MERRTKKELKQLVEEYGVKCPVLPCLVVSHYIAVGQNTWESKSIKEDIERVIKKKYDEEKQKILNKLIQNWYGKEGDINSLSIHYLICALDQVRCDLLNKDQDGDGEIYLTIKQTLTNKLLDLVQHIEKYPLREELGTIYQIYLLIQPNFPNDMNRLFVISRRENKYVEKGYDYCLGVDYMPESGNWCHGHYDASSPEVWEEYIKENYGKAIPLL